MRMRITITVLAAMVLLSFAAYGCGRKEPASGDNRLVVRINNYKMTVKDFKDEARFIMAASPEGGGVSANDNILDEIITKKVLLQEAQRYNFDKNRTFMKEVERYWEQALLKLLYKNKVEELSRAISVSDDEVRGEYVRLVNAKAIDEAAQPFDKVSDELRKDIYTRKLQNAINIWINGLKAAARIKKYSENLSGI